MCHGLTTMQTRKFPYQYANANGFAPSTWLAKEQASIDWLKRFMAGQKTLYYKYFIIAGSKLQHGKC